MQLQLVPKRVCGDPVAGVVLLYIQTTLAGKESKDGNDLPTVTLVLLLDMRACNSLDPWDVCMNLFLLQLEVAQK